jgi:hypothetical protein
MKTYIVQLTFVQCSRAEVKIKARSFKEAERMADEISSEDVEDWNPVDGNLTVESVEEES